MTGSAGDKYLVLAYLLQRCMAEISGGVRGKVSSWIMDLIEHLFLDGIGSNFTAGTLRLRDDEVSVLFKLYNWEPHMSQVDSLLVWGICKSSAGTLGATFDEVSRQDSLAELVRILFQRPAVLVAKGCQSQRRIRYASRDDHVRTVFQCLHDSLYAAVGVAGDQLIPDIAQLAGEFQHIVIVIILNVVKNVISNDSSQL